MISQLVGIGAAVVNRDDHRTYPPGWMRTRSGRVVNLLDPKPEMISLHDIAYSLARLPRWGGHTAVPYSVAEHSLRVMENVRAMRAWGRDACCETCVRNLLLAALLHDAHEAYIGDITSPVGAVLGSELVHALKQRVQDAIYARLHLSPPDYIYLGPRQTWADVVKAADIAALDDEWRRYMVEPIPESSFLHSAGFIQDRFVGAALRLGGARVLD